MNQYQIGLSQWPAERQSGAGSRKRENGLIRALGLAQIIVFSGLVLRTPYLYETNDISDSMFMLNTGWAVFNGDHPVADFTHAYGGLLSSLIAATFHVAGVSAKALDYVLLPIYGLAAALLFAVGRRRLGRFAWLGALALVTALTFTRNPLEYGKASISVASHAMLYNRMAWAFFFAAILPAALPARRGSETLGCAASAVAAFLMIASKPTFAIGLPAILAGFVLTDRPRLLARWAIAFVLAAAVYWAITGFGPGQWVALYDYLLVLGARLIPGLFAPEWKFMLSAASDFFQIAVALFACALLLNRGSVRARRTVFAALVVLVAALGIAVTTGNFRLQFVQTPAAAMVAVIVFEAARRRGIADLAITGACVLLVAHFALPHMLNAVSSGLKEGRHVLVPLETAGGFEGYVVEPESATRLPLALGPDGMAQEVARRLEQGRNIDRLNGQDQFLIVRDGLQALRGIEGYRELGVISPYRRLFSVGLKAKPVLSYPFDPKIELPEFDTLTALGDDVDVVMILRADDSRPKLRARLLEAAGPDFALVQQTRFWDIYRRNGG